MGHMYYSWKNMKRDIDVRQYVYYISSYHYNWHDALELLIVLRGEIEVSMNGKIHILAEDDLVIINSNVGHATLARKPHSIAMVIHLNPIYFSSYYRDYRLLEFTCISSYTTRNDASFSRIRQYAIEMLQHIKGSRPSDRICYESSLNQLLATLIQCFPPTEISSTEMASNRKKTDAVNKIIHYIDNHYKNKISLEDLSKVSGYHKSYISQIVKQHLGINYYEYLTRIRLREATYALIDLDQKISDIALSYGFSEVKSFNTAFRNSFGKTPSEYRKQLSVEKWQSMNREKTYLSEEDFERLMKSKEVPSPAEFAQQEQQNRDEKDRLREEDYQSLQEIKKSLDECLAKIETIEKNMGL